MRVVIVSCVFPPEPVTSASTSANMAEECVKNSDDVIVIAPFPNRPSGEIYPGYRRKLFSKSKAPDGYILYRCFTFFSRESSILSRLIENASFGLMSGILLLVIAKPDVVYANTWPLIATGLIRLVCALRKVPVVISIQDVYPESLVIQNRIGKDSLLFRLLAEVDKKIVSGAKALIVISEIFNEIYSCVRNYPPEGIFIVPNWVDDRELNLEAGEHDPQQRSLGRSQDTLLVVYGGNVGVAAGVQQLIQAWSSLQITENIRLLIAGEGTQLQRCKRFAEDLPPGLVNFHSPWKKSETGEVLSAADILILPTFGSQSLVSVPSKLVTYMLVGKPIIALCMQESEIAYVINSAGCGWVVPPGDFDQLVTLLRSLKDQARDHLHQMGQAGRRYARQRFSREKNAARIYSILHESARSG